MDELTEETPLAKAKRELQQARTFQHIAASKGRVLEAQSWSVEIDRLTTMLWGMVRRERAG